MRNFIRAVVAVGMFIAMIVPALGATFTAKDLALEEAKFAAYSVKNGMRAAFVEFFAEQSWLLRPEPVDAKEWLRARPDPKIILDWKSLRTMLAASGDLGFSTGPWLLRSKADPNAPAAHGQFFLSGKNRRTANGKCSSITASRTAPPPRPMRYLPPR